MKAKIQLLVILFVCILLLATGLWFQEKNQVVEEQSHASAAKLYWFIPDGFRADPDVFRVFEWADQGLLPNIKKLKDRGAWGYSIPVFPGHTPTNFATLLTGSYPEVHGVADGPMRVQGYPIKMVSIGGFSSVAKKVPPIWYTLEEQGLRGTLLSVPGSTPPELNEGITIKGRWGGWGIEFPSVIFHTDQDRDLRVEQNFGNRVFYFGPNLTTFLPIKNIKGWSDSLRPTYSPYQEIEFKAWGMTLFGLVVDSTDDNKVNYDRLLLSFDRKKIIEDLAVGEWGDWQPVELAYQLKNDYNLHTPKKMEWERELSSVDVPTSIRLKVIKLGASGFFRVRMLFDGLNPFLVKPSYVYDAIAENVGPMVDFVDNYPAQLIYYDEDRPTFVEESKFSLDWHKKMAGYMTSEIESDFYIQNTYTPNQWLTSRWWLPAIDPKSRLHERFSPGDKEDRRREVLQMYQGIDAILGEAMKNMPEDAFIVLSSDHGAVPLNQEVRLNNFFAKKGWLHFTINKVTGEYEIDWKKSTVIYLKMDNVYINPNGLDGEYYRAKGPKYEKLRGQVIESLRGLEFNGQKVVSEVLKHEQVSQLGLPSDRTGDLVIANKAGFGWIEEVDASLKIFKKPRVGGYKQAVLPKDEKGMWTPFLIAGPGIKKGYEISRPIDHIEQYPTIMKGLGAQIPEFVQGQPLKEVFTKE